MFKFIFLLVVLAWSNVSLCATTSLIKSYVQQFLDTNSNLRKGRLEQKVQSYSIDEFNSQYSWQIGAELKKENDKSQLPFLNFPTAPTQDYQKNLGNFKVGKKLAIGSELSFENKLFEYEKLETYEVQSSIRLRQELGKNFFGRLDCLDKQAIEENIDLTKASYNKVELQSIYQFLAAWIEYSSAQKLLAFQQKALKRGQQRYQVTKKRRRDGMVELADVYDAKGGLFKQRQELKNRIFQLRQARLKLEELLHKKHIGAFPNLLDKSFDSFWNDHPKNSKSLAEHPEILEIKTQGKLIDTQFIKADKSILPEIYLFGELNTNWRDEKFSDAIEEGYPGGRRRNVVVGIGLSMPIGFQKESAARSKARIQKEVNNYIQKQTHENLKLRHGKINRDLNDTLAIIKINSERQVALLKAFNSYNRLFKLGRRTVDVVIRADENAIASQMEGVMLIANWRKQVLEKLFLEGTLKEKIGI